MRLLWRRGCMSGPAVTAGAGSIFYACTSYQNKGRTICRNNLEGRMTDIDAAVLGAIGGQVLSEDVVRDVVAGVIAALEPDTRASEATRVRAELAAVQTECGRLIEAVAAGGDMPMLVESLRARQTRVHSLQDTLGRVAEQRPAVDARQLEAAVRARLGHWRELLTEQVQSGRLLLRQNLTGPIQFTPVERDGRRGYSFRGEVGMSELLTGAIDLPTTMASPICASWNQLGRWLKAIDGLRCAA